MLTDKEQKISTRLHSEYSEYEFFYKANSPFSQWHMHDFVADGITFNCAEQYMMYHKAMLFDDEEIAEKILDAQKPGTQKSMGRVVKGYKQSMWGEHRYDVIYRGNIAKFSTPSLKPILLETKGKLLVEASLVDLIYGVGMVADNPLIHNPNNWKGVNLFGMALTEVRESLEE